MTAATDGVGFVLLLLASLLVAGRIAAGFWQWRQDRAWRRRNADWDRDIADTERRRQKETGTEGGDKS